MATNYVLLERIELNTSAASITFANIPQSGYTDLKIEVSALSTYSSSTASEYYSIYFNGSNSGLTYRRLYGSGSSPGSDNGALGLAGAISANGWTANTFTNGSIYIPNYTSSNAKSFSVDSVAENNSATVNGLDLVAGLWSGTSAISSITVIPRRDNFAQYSTFSLYGIADVNTSPTLMPMAEGGNIITTDGTYWYHAFLASGTFTPQTALTCDYLVVAGGGGGGGNSGGGGGAGGFRTSTAYSTTSGTNYSITIGAGGAGADTEPASGSKGSDSVFATITSEGGGYGAGYGVTGGNGGSGGGGNEVSSTAGGTATSGQGYNGGSGSSGGGYGGGGGGAGEAGNTDGAKQGGDGLNTLSTWANATNTGVNGYYAGGGGAGGAGASGVGGDGGGGTGCAGTGSTQTAGTPNTGGGGGGGGDQSRTGRAGGSGIVIIRYPV